MYRNRERNKFYTGIVNGLMITLVLWLIGVAAVLYSRSADATIGGGYIWVHTYEVKSIGSWEPFYIHPRMPHWMQCPATVTDPKKCHEKYYRVGDTITITWERDGEVSHIYKRNQTDPEFSRYGENWMLVFIGPGYVGSFESNNLWSAKNERTGDSWAIYELDHVRPDKRPMAPSGLK